MTVYQYKNGKLIDKGSHPAVVSGVQELLNSCRFVHGVLWRFRDKILQNGRSLQVLVVGKSKFVAKRPLLVSPYLIYLLGIELSMSHCSGILLHE